MSTRAIRRGATTIAAAGGLLVLSAAYASASGRATQANTYAHAASGPSYVVSFSPNKPNEDSDLSITLTDPQQPTSVTFGLPAGSTLNLGAVPICSAAPACEPATQVGSGSATVVVNGYTISLSFAVFNTAAGGVALVIEDPNGPPVVEKGAWSGTKLTIDYPNGTYNGHQIVVTQLALTFNTAGVGRGNYIRTPAKCTGTGWGSTAGFTFAGAATATPVNALAKCEQPASKKKKKKKKKS
jgi:hypothetical protein